MATESQATARSLVEGVEGSALALIAIAAGFAAGILHLIVAPDHFSEHLGQGLFMVTVGFLQVLWAVWYLRRPSFASYVSGLVLAVGCIVVWIVATLIHPPFQSDAEPLMPTAWATEIVQTVTVLALLLLPFRRGAGAAVGRAFPLVALVLLLGVVAGGAAYGAGIAGDKVAPDLFEKGTGGDSMAPASTKAPSGSTSMSGMPMNTSASTQASTNASTSGSTKDPNMPSDPSACMTGMDMPGCSAAQADYYFAKQAANAPPPDKSLPNVKIALTQDGTGETAKTTLDNGTMRLMIKITLKSTSTGPYLVQGPGAAPNSGDLVVQLTPPGAKAPTVKIPIKGSGGSAGVDPAAPLSMTAGGDATMPDMGDWTVSIGGSGVNADVTVALTERFVM